jgi:integrase
VREWNRQQLVERAYGVVRVTVDAAIQDYLGACSTVRPATLDDYARTLGHFASRFGSLFVSDLGGRQLDEWIAARMAAVSEATAAKNLRGVRVFLRWCVRRGLLAVDPVGDVRGRPSDHIARERPAVSEAQFALLLVACGSETRRLAVLVAATTGIDRGDVGRLTSEHIDLERLCIWVQRTKKRGARLVRRSRPLHPALVDRLYNVIGCTVPGHALFPDVGRRPYRLDWFREAARTAGCSRLWFRDLRAYASAYLGQVLRPDEVQRELDHASIETTLTHYPLPRRDVQLRIATLPLPGARSAGRASESRSA